MCVTRCLLNFADAEFTRDTSESLPTARELYLDVLDLLNLPEMRPLNTGFQPNPVPIALQNHASTNLLKLRNGLNIAGAQRSATPGIASSGAGQLALQTMPAAQPTPYRYATLIERAKQLNQLAQQVENSYFAALQQRDAETYNLLKANHDLELAGANVALQALQLAEASDGVILAADQNTRVQTQFNTYASWINAGPLQSEQDMIEQYKSANEARNWAEGLGVAMTAAQGLLTASSGGFLGLGISAGYAPALVLSALAGGKAAADIAADNASTQAQIDSANASFERRLQEWQFQRSLAANDLTISKDQITLANDKVAIVNQQSTIVTIQDAHARAIVNFLSTKFTNVELYEWMSGVLGGVYRYFLQQSTAIAQLAEKQLSFERQQPGLALIKADYWQPPFQPSTAADAGGPADRQGLTGSARLIEDITQLDQYAFLTDSRKLQLTKTISLARLVPFEFQQFRETGVLSFVTPQTLFDRDFPGHYLRLIKRVRTSLVALVPPNQGIKASLSTTGISRVTLGGDVFQTVSVQRKPESIALTSPMNATGLFELDAQPELLLPFEGTGVDTSWEFRMPRAANLFDYSTIADILLTIDYTALDSPDYRRQVIQKIDRNLSLDRAFSFREDLASQWYDMNNPDQLTTPFSVQFSTAPEDFPSNIDDLQIQNVLLHFVHADNQRFEISDVSITAAGMGGNASTVDCTISNRRGNAASWKNMLGKSPIQNWTLTIPDTPDTIAGPGTRTLIRTGAIQDILLVITYTGTLPAWDNA
jgi:Tc toxin complex TcA C-terminal TcB-binding domain